MSTPFVVWCRLEGKRPRILPFTVCGVSSFVAAALPVVGSGLHNGPTLWPTSNTGFSSIPPLSDDAHIM